MSVSGVCAAAGGGAGGERWRASLRRKAGGEHGGGPVVNLCGKLTPRESAAAFERARMFVGHDSGPMHLAAAVQTPCVAIFAARNIPRVWFPFGEQHRVVYHRVDCMGCGLETCVVRAEEVHDVDHGGRGDGGGGGCAGRRSRVRVR